MSSAARKLNPVQPATSTPAVPRSLISNNVDMLFIGGGSLLLLGLMMVMLNQDVTVGAGLGWAVFSLSFIVNMPHFLVSYQLLYSDFGAKIFKEARFFWAAVAAPTIIAGVLVAGFTTGNPKLLGYVASSMFFFVGWHYVKQIFGGITVTNALRGFFYNSTERAILKANLFSLWAISFLGANTMIGTYNQDGIAYESWNLPPYLLNWAYYALAISGAGVVLMNVQKYIREGKTPAPAAIVCFLTIYAWYIPLFSHPLYMHTIPFFHSLQYLLFVYTFRRNKVYSETNVATPEGRSQRVLGLYGYLLVPVITGAMFMYLIPRKLDALGLGSGAVFGPTPAYFAFVIFINIHHYFIDNVIWRGNNDQLKKHLFQTVSK